jgi:exodeoxyribonuclease VII small subunit
MAGRSGPSAPPEPELRFEQALEQLEALVARLEGGGQSLEDALRAFEDGVRLVRLCSERLRAAEVRVRELVEGPDGPLERSLVPEPTDDEDDDAEEDDA